MGRGKGNEAWKERCSIYYRGIRKVLRLCSIPGTARSVTSSGQVQESWERDDRDQETAWQTCLSRSVCQIRHFWEGLFKESGTNSNHYVLNGTHNNHYVLNG